MCWESPMTRSASGLIASWTGWSGDFGDGQRKCPAAGDRGACSTPRPSADPKSGPDPIGWSRDDTVQEIKRIRFLDPERIPGKSSPPAGSTRPRGCHLPLVPLILWWSPSSVACRHSTRTQASLSGDAYDAVHLLSERDGGSRTRFAKKGGAFSFQRMPAGGQRYHEATAVVVASASRRLFFS